jgi:hypothetical protein
MRRGQKSYLIRQRRRGISPDWNMSDGLIIKIEQEDDDEKKKKLFGSK